MSAFFQVLGRSLTLAAAALLLPPMLWAVTRSSLLGGIPMRNLALMAFIVFILATVIQVVQRLRRRQAKATPAA